LGEFHGMSSQSNVSHCRVLPVGEFTVMIPELCHIVGCSHLAKSMSWSWHIAGCNNSIRHIENRFSPYFIIFVFNAVWALTSGGFRIVPGALVINRSLDVSRAIFVCRSFQVRRMLLMAPRHVMDKQHEPHRSSSNSCGSNKTMRVQPFLRQTSLRASFILTLLRFLERYARMC